MHLHQQLIYKRAWLWHLNDPFTQTRAPIGGCCRAQAHMTVWDEAGLELLSFQSQHNLRNCEAFQVEITVAGFDTNKNSRPSISFHQDEGCADLQVFVEDASHGGERAVISLVFDEPRLGHPELRWVDEDEAAWLSEGFQDERRQPGTCKDIQRQRSESKLFIFFSPLFSQRVLKRGKKPFGGVTRCTNASLRRLTALFVLS